MPEYPIQQLIDDIARSTLPEEFDRAAQSSIDKFDMLNVETIEEKGITVACREGCSLCCWLRVDVFAHEAFLIVHHIQSHFSADKISDLSKRLAAHSEKVLPLTPFEHVTQNVACALLHDGRCSVYAVRPHSCRRHHSGEFAACQFTFDHPDDLAAPAAHDRELFRALTEAMQENINAYSQLGFDDTIYELGTSLHEALNDTTSWKRWHDRGRAFLHASVTPAG